MRTLSEVVLLVGRIDHLELYRWVELGWIAPARPIDQEEGPGEPAFSDLDIARVRLICDLRHDLAVEEDTVPLVLSLLDQLYAMRRHMNALSGALRQQPEDVRRAVMDLVEASRRRDG